MQKVAKSLLMVVMAVCLMLSSAFTVSAETVPKEVLDVRDSVVRLEVTKLVFTDETGKQYDDLLFWDQEIGYNLLGIGQLATYIGTGFLIGTDDNSLDTIITASHVVGESVIEVWVPIAEDQAVQAEGWFVATEYSAIIGRDYKVPCEVYGNSLQSEFAILKLKNGQSFVNRKGAVLHVGEPLETGRAIHVLGFPGDITNSLLQSEFKPEDVVITSGNVNRYGDVMMNYADSKAGSPALPCYTHSAITSGGNSGGPVVDENGVVVGIHIASDNENTRRYAVDISLVLTILDSLGIGYKKDYVNTSTLEALLREAEAINTDQYTDESAKALKSAITAAESALSAKAQEEIEEACSVLRSAIDGLAIKTAAPVQDEVDTEKLEKLLDEAEDVDTSLYTKETVDELKDAIDEAEDALSAKSQQEVDRAYRNLKNAMDDLEKQQSSSFLKDYALIILIVLLVLAAVVIIVVLLTRKNRDNKLKADRQNQAAYGHAQPTVHGPAQNVQAHVQGIPSPAPAYQPAVNSNMNETTVLNASDPGTTVLHQAVNGGTLIREKNNSVIAINFADFAIGRDNSVVNYVVSDNTSVSRIHARFVVRSGKTYIIDNNAANGTFVNGVKLRAGQEVELNSGDVIALSDEKFRFTK